MVQSNSDFLFVYGTLQSQHHNQYAQLLRKNATLIGKAFCNGIIYQIDWYPGLELSDSPLDIVDGELYQIHKNVDLFRILDIYENVESGEYIRKKITIFCDNKKYEAWTYIYNWEIPNM